MVAGVVVFPFSPAEALRSVENIPSSCLAGVIACQNEDALAPFAQQASIYVAN